MKRLCAFLAAAAMSVGPTFADEPHKPATQKVWSDASTNLLGGPSPDGKLLSFVDPASGDLAVYDLASKTTRALTHNPPKAATFAYFSVFSRDSSRLAYAWFNEEGFYELWTADVEGGAPRRLYRNPETGFVQPCDWSPDGSEILTLFFRKDNVSQIALVSAADGSVRVLKTLSWFYPKKISFSPDGKFILYDSLTGRDEAARDILLLSADASGERQLISGKANDIFPLWTPSGDGIVFASDRSGDMDLWLVPVADGALAGEPRRIARSFGRALPLGITRRGVYYFGLHAGRTNVVTASFRDGKLGEPRTAGRGVEPAWSHDGLRLAYLTQLGTENYGRQSRGVTVWAPATGQDSLLTPSLAYLSRLHWSPDDARLLAEGSDGRGRSGLFAVDPGSGAAEAVVRVHGGDPRGLEGAWLDAGAVAYISADRKKIMRLELEGREEKVLLEAKPGEELRLLAAGPSGGQVLFGKGGEGAVRELHVAELESGETRRVMRAEQGPISAVDWAGDALHVTTEERTGAVVWRVSLSGGAPEKTSIRAGASGPRISPDGAQAAFVVSDERSEVWSLDGWLAPATGER